MDGTNKLYFGDNLDILREHVADASVDLIYLDPPFNSNANYNVLFKEKTGEESAAQITAFEDTWQWSVEAEAVYREIVTSGPRDLAHLVQAFLAFLGRNDMMAYLAMMAPRLAELHRVLKPTGSIYLHCDPTSSHYLKLLLDAVFLPENFRNEIIWRRTRGHYDTKLTRFGAVHDVILFYARSKDRRFNRLHIERPDLAPQTHDIYIHTDGQTYRKGDCRAPGGRGPRYEWNGHVQNWRFTEEERQRLEAEGRIVYSKTGMPRVLRPIDPTKRGTVQDVWVDIDPPNSGSAETLGYPTQKPEALLERIIRASSNEGDTVLDPFCGCGTAVAVAERLKRWWIGIDITYLAINLVQRRLKDHHPTDLSPFEIIGAPTDLASAEALKEISPHQFEWWAVDMVDARPAKDHKKGADSGIDGYINFFDDKSGQAKQVIVQVKSGHIGVNHVRDLKGVLEREKAAIGALITLREPTKPMLTEAAAAGFYEPKDFPGKYPRVQILTIAELLDGKKILHPEHRVETFARAERKTKAQQDGLF